MMIYLRLFWSFFQIGLFSIGGGYAAMPLIRDQVVHINGWLTMNEFADVVTISQMTPGPIALNAATFIGIRMGGIPGAVIATLGCIFPSCIITLLLAYIYYRYRKLSAVKGAMNGLRPAVVAMIASAVFSLMELTFWSDPAVVGKIESIDYVSVVLFLLALFTLRRWKANPIVIMIGTGLLGLLIYPLI